MRAAMRPQGKGEDVGKHVSRVAQEGEAVTQDAADDLSRKDEEGNYYAPDQPFFLTCLHGLISASDPPGPLVFEPRVGIDLSDP